jgi:Mg2+-importing ATPase
MPAFQKLNTDQLASIALAAPEAALDRYKSRASGLTDEEALARHLKTGPNMVTTHAKMHPLLELLQDFKNPLILIMLSISLIFILMGETINGAIILVMILMSVLLNFYQEYQATQAAEKLQDRVALFARVRRSGKDEDLKAILVTYGDVIVLNAGDLIPADARILTAKDFFVNQSTLTGESFPVEKSSPPISKSGSDITDLTNLVFSGTSVVTGTATAMVFEIGIKTQLGSIVKDLNIAEEDNDFTRGVKEFSAFITRVIMVLVILVFGINFLIHHNLFSSFSFAIAVAVGLTPEFLPMILSVTMSRGSMAMAKKGVIVKKLTAIPTFGSMDILCTDKTGTLTQDKIQLVKYVTLTGEHSPDVLLHAYLNSYHQTGINNPMDEAVKAYKHLDIKKYSKIDEIPFDFERKCMSVVVNLGQERLLITKGAPENILKVSQFYGTDGHRLTLTPAHRDQALKQYHLLSAQGYRVIAVATKPVTAKDAPYTKEDEQDLTLLGFTAFLDPVKNKVKEAIDQLEAIGIEMKVITGDNELVSQKICTDAGIQSKGTLLGHEADKMTDQELQERSENTTIFARFSPSQKNRVILALKKNGHVVGYMGDGINDAPSLRSADVGISVENAVDVAKESAALILTHKSLRELYAGVVEGRKIFGNTMKYILMGLSSNFGNMFSVLGAVIFIPFLPMLPIQILLNNFLYDLSQLTIPSDTVDEEYIKSPKRWDIHFIRRFMFTLGPVSSLFDFISYGVLYYFFSHNPSAFQTGWFMESLATQTFVIYVIRTRKIPILQSRPSLLLMISTIMAVSLGWLIPYTALGKAFQFFPLPWHVVSLIILIVLIYLILTQIIKTLFYRCYPSKPAPLKASLIS